MNKLIEMIKNNQHLVWVIVLGSVFFTLAIYGSTREPNIVETYEVWANIWLAMCTIFCGVLAVFNLILISEKN